MSHREGPGCPAGLVPYARALRAFGLDGRTDVSLTVHSDLGEHEPMPVGVFFRDGGNLFPFEQAALDGCRGRVLELGAGAGSDALVLQQRGFVVTAVDVVPVAVEIMRARQVRDARLADWRTLEEPADTVLILMNGAGWTGTLDGLSTFLERVHGLVAEGGQLVLDGGPAPGGRAEDDPMEWPERTGPYPGEAWIRLEFDGEIGPAFRELYVDFETLAGRAASAGWFAQRIFEGEGDSWVARLLARL